MLAIVSMHFAGKVGHSSLDKYPPRTCAPGQAPPGHLPPLWSRHKGTSKYAKHLTIIRAAFEGGGRLSGMITKPGGTYPGGACPSGGAHVRGHLSRGRMSYLHDTRLTRASRLIDNLDTDKTNSPLMKREQRRQHEYIT